MNKIVICDTGYFGDVDMEAYCSALERFMRTRYDMAVIVTSGATSSDDHEFYPDVETDRDDLVWAFQDALDCVSPDDFLTE